MRYTTTDHIIPILTSLTTPFDTHSVEREFQSRHPHLFAAEVGRYATTARDPLHTFSARFGRWLLDSFADVIRPTRKVVTQNLRSLPSSNQEWALLHP